MSVNELKTPSKRIQTTITAAFATLVFATALVMALLSYTFTRQAVQRTSRDYTTQLITLIQTNIDSYITHMDNITEVVQLNDQVQRFLARGDSIPPEEDSAYRTRISAFLNSISRTRDDISLILLVGSNGELLAHDSEILLNPVVNVAEQEWYRAARHDPGQAVVSSSHVQNIVDGSYRWVITLSRTINDPMTAEEYGVMLVDMNFSVISRLLSRTSLGKKGYLFVIADDGSIVFHPRQELIYSDLEREYIDRVLAVKNGSFVVDDEKGKRIYTVSTSLRTGWRTVGVNYLAELVRNRATIQRYYIYWTMICIVLAVFVSVVISHRLSRPILRLRSSMRAVERGDFDISVDVTSNNEIGELARDFNIMIARIKELVRRNAEEQEAKRKSELTALQNQITPHFLYNTLDSVIWMAESKRYTDVVDMVSSLARLLRLSVSRGEELVSIRDEIEHIKSYLTIQKLRYNDKLDFTIAVHDAIMPLRVPKVILQPLVENAIYHGIKNKEEGGAVAINGGIVDDQVVLSVLDDGVGMSAEQRDAILEKRPLPQRSRQRTRVGVLNVHERIRLYFGPEYGLSFRENHGGGTVVDVFLPIVDETTGPYEGGTK